MASDKSMYWLAAGVLALGIGTRYGRGPNGNEWVACAVDRTSEILNRVTDRASSQAERSVMLMNDHQIEMNDRAAAAMVRVQCSMAEVSARQAAAEARMRAAMARVDNRMVRVQLGQD
jgi:hypothetical protein